MTTPPAASQPPPNPFGELQFATVGNRAHLSRLAATGRAQRLATGIYAVGASFPPDRVAYHHRLAIIGRIWPAAVLSARTALSGGEPSDGWMFITHPAPDRASNLKLAGLTISVRTGPGQLPGDMTLPHGTYLAGPARSLVENVDAAGRPAAGRPNRTAGTEAVEDRIDEQARTGGAGRVQNILAQLDLIAGYMPSGAVELVRKRLVALLGTASGDTPTSGRLRARLQGTPFDQHRLDMFHDLAQFLADVAPEPRAALGSPARWEWLAFFESYFSNFIEGTQFGVEEARQIAIEGLVPSERPSDAHDIAATYRIASDATLSRTVAATGSDFLDLLRSQHATLMAARPDKNPGAFKRRPNYAGGYQFVEPACLEGTLLRGFDVLTGLADPLHRAIATMFLVTECHPFDDGNGRLARLVANAHLSAAGQVRIVVPTVYRNDYLAALNAMSNRAGRGEALHAVLAFAQKWTAAIDWSNYDRSLELLDASYAFVDASTAERNGTRLRLPPLGS